MNYDIQKCTDTREEAVVDGIQNKGVNHPISLSNSTSAPVEKNGEDQAQEDIRCHRASERRIDEVHDLWHARQYLDLDEPDSVA